MSFVRGSERDQVRFRQLIALNAKLQSNFESFNHFTMNSWKYMSDYSARAWNTMSSAEKRDFNFDIKSVDWKKAETSFLFGIRRYFLKEDTMAPETQFQ